MIKKKIKSIVAGFVAAAFVIAAPTVAMATSHNNMVDNNGNSNAHNKVTICHATGSTSNPYVQITPNANGVVNGHESHQDGNDIIPAFDYNDHGTTMHFAGQNWDSNGQMIWNNGCKTTGNEGGGPTKDCDGDYDNSSESDCNPATNPTQDCDGDYDNSAASECNTNTTTTENGGQGAGQVLAATTANTAAGVQQTPVGGVNAGAGGGSTLSFSLSL